MDINDKGEIIDHKIFQSYIKSSIQMTYKKVNDIIKNKDVIDMKSRFTEEQILRSWKSTKAENEQRT